MTLPIVHWALSPQRGPLCQRFVVSSCVLLPLKSILFSGEFRKPQQPRVCQTRTFAKYLGSYNLESRWEIQLHFPEPFPHPLLQDRRPGLPPIDLLAPPRVVYASHDCSAITCIGYRLDGRRETCLHFHRRYLFLLRQWLYGVRETPLPPLP